MADATLRYQQPLIIQDSELSTRYYVRDIPPLEAFYQFGYPATCKQQKRGF